MLFRSQAAIQPQFPQRPEVLEACGGQLACGHQQGEGDGQVERRPLLAQVCRSEADDHPGLGHAATAVAQGRTHPLAGLAPTDIIKTDEMEPRQAWRRVGLDEDGLSLKTGQGRAGATGKHGIPGTASSGIPRKQPAITGGAGINAGRPAADGCGELGEGGGRQATILPAEAHFKATTGRSHGRDPGVAGGGGRQQGLKRVLRDPV